MNHQRKPLRLNAFDYKQNGFYFVTVCTQNRRNCLGDMNNGSVILNDWGLTVQKEWKQLPDHYPNCRLDIFVIMPNHIHGVIEIHNVGAGSPGPLSNTYKGGETPPLRIGSLSEMMGYFKYQSTKQINESAGTKIFQWQRGFYDHIIRNENDLNHIREYIQNNPGLWDMDENNVTPKII